MEPVIVIVGPTASGKSALAVELASRINGEIISADSMQIYRYMDIGTAKPAKEEMRGIKHYMIDELSPDEDFSVARFQESALKSIMEITAKGRHPIVAGGTGLYVNSLVYNINFSETEADWELRDSLKSEAVEKGNKYLHDKLREMDPEAAARLHENDVKRIIRAIEVFTQTKMTISQHIDNSRLVPPPYNYIVYGLNMDRQKLYRRIENRIDRMMDNGLVDEVKKLVALGYDKNAVAMQGLGYKEILAFIRGEATLEEAVEILKRDTRRYAKRQITWFKRIENIHWIDIDEISDYTEIAKIMQDSIATSGIFL